MVRRAITGKPAQPQQIQPMQGMAKGMIGMQQQIDKDAKANGRTVQHQEPERVEVDVNKVQATEFASRLNELNDKFHEQRIQGRKGKRVSFDVIDDNRITPSERLRLFVEAATQQGYDPKEAIEFALKRMEQGPVAIEIKPAPAQVKTGINFEELLTKK